MNCFYSFFEDKNQREKQKHKSIEIIKQNVKALLPMPFCISSQAESSKQNRKEGETNPKTNKIKLKLLI